MKIICLIIVLTIGFNSNEVLTNQEAYNDANLYIFNGAGSILAEYLYTHWKFGYLMDHADLNYLVTDSTAATQKLSNNEISFAAVDKVMEISGLVFLPHIATPWSIIYNPPHCARAHLDLNKASFSSLFLGHITNWNQLDGFCDYPIEIVVVNEDYGGNRVLSGALSVISPEWKEKYGIFDRPNQAYLDCVKPTTVLRDLTMIGFIANKKGTIGYSPFPSVKSQSSGISFANLYDNEGNLLKGSSPVFNVVMDRYIIEKNQWTNISYMNVPHAWPFAGITYLSLNYNYSINTTCDQRRELLLFWNWTVNSRIAKAYLEFRGYMSLGLSLSQFTEELESMKCHNGAYAIEMLRQPQHEPRHMFITMICFAYTFVVGSILVVAIYVIRDFHKIPPPALVFMFFMLLGALTNCLAITFFFIVPDQTWICQFRQWLTALGFSYMFSAIFVRAFQIRAIYSISKRSRILTTKKNKIKSVINMVTYFSVLIGSQLLLLILWSSIDTYKSTRIEVDEFARTFSYACSSRTNWIWFGIQISYFILLLGFGLLVVYLTWDMKYLVMESKWIAICIYNTVFTLGICIAILAGLDANDDVIFWVAVTAVSLLTTLTLLAIYLPKLLRTGLSDSDSQTGTNRSKSSGSSR